MSGSNSGSGSGPERTILVVADDFRVLTLAEAVLQGKGHRVLVAIGAQFAVRLLTRGRVPIHSVAIQADMSGREDVSTCSLRRGAKPWTFRCHTDDRRVVLEGLDSGADWESAGLEAQ